MLADGLLERADKLLVVLPTGGTHATRQSVVQLLPILILVVEQHGKLLLRRLLRLTCLAEVLCGLFYGILRQIAQDNQR
ncbi:hypothetical protein D3C76_1643510 [compost metagenome]